MLHKYKTNQQSTMIVFIPTHEPGSVFYKNTHIPTIFSGKFMKKL